MGQRVEEVRFPSGGLIRNRDGVAQYHLGCCWSICPSTAQVFRKLDISNGISIRLDQYSGIKSRIYCGTSLTLALRTGSHRDRNPVLFVIVAKGRT
jgi:hypothetical protein